MLNLENPKEISKSDKENISHKIGNQCVLINDAAQNALL